MADNLGTGKHLMKDGQQIGQALRLSGRAGVAGQSVLVQSALIADTDGAMVVWHGMSPDLKQHAVLRHRTVASDIEVIADNMTIYAFLSVCGKSKIIFYNKVEANLATL